MKQTFFLPVLQGVEEAFYSLVREIRRYKETNRSNKKSKKNTQRRCIILQQTTHTSIPRSTYFMLPLTHCTSSVTLEKSSAAPDKGADVAKLFFFFLLLSQFPLKRFAIYLALCNVLCSVLHQFSWWSQFLFRCPNNSRVQFLAKKKFWLKSSFVWT